jgi:type IV pilus assembly protein PilM
LAGDPVIGLDIGTYSIKALELEKKDGVFTLLDFKIQERESHESLAESLKRFLGEARFISRELNFAVGGHSVLVRIIELPAMRDEELKSALRFEVEKFLPFSIDEATLDYQVVFNNQGTKKATILAAAVKKDFVKGYSDIISQAGFSIKAVDIDGIALSNAFLNAHPQQQTANDDKVYALLHLGDSTLNMSIIYKGVPFVLRDINGAGRDISEVIAKGMGIGKKEAYKIKHDPPQAERDTLLEMIRPTLAKFAREVNLSIGYFENQFSKGIETVYLSGGSSRLFGIKESLAESLDVQIEFWDSFDSIASGKDVSVKSLENSKQDLPIALGLAIRDD